MMSHPEGDYKDDSVLVGVAMEMAQSAMVRRHNLLGILKELRLMAVFKRALLTSLCCALNKYSQVMN